MQNMIQMLPLFNQFKRQFQGNPQEEVQKLLASGRMTQQQLNKLQAMAKEFEQLLNTR